MDVTHIPTLCFKGTFLRTVHKYVGSPNSSQVCKDYQSFSKNLQAKFQREQICHFPASGIGLLEGAMRLVSTIYLLL